MSQTTVSLDRTDREILKIIQTEGRIHNQALADRVHLSPSACLRRMRALEDAGFILGYRTLLDTRKLGLSLMALLHISMDHHTPERFERFETEICELPNILECLLITGQQADYQLKIAVPDMDAYQELLLHRITRIPGVTGAHSSFVLRKIIEHRALPIVDS